MIPCDIYLPLCDLLSMTISRAVCVAANGIISLFLMAEWYSIVYMCHISIHSSVDGHLGCFHVLAVVRWSFLLVISVLKYLNNTICLYGASLVAQIVKNLQCKRSGFDLWVRKIPLEKGKATHSCILAWRIPWTEELGVVYSPWSCTELDVT